MAAVVAAPVLVMLLAVGSLSGQPIYAGEDFNPVKFTFTPNDPTSTPATVQLLRVKPFAPEEIPPELKQRFPRLGESGAQVWVYGVTSGRAPAISNWYLGLCPDITRDDILRETEPFEGPKETPPTPTTTPSSSTPRTKTTWSAPSPSRSWAAGPSCANRH